MIRLVIEKMSKGGFVVYDGDGLGQGGQCPSIFAATDIADALGFIGDNMAPVEKAHPDKGEATAATRAYVGEPWPYCSIHGAAWCSERREGDRCKKCPHTPLAGAGDPPCTVCGSMHAETYCARQTCPGTHGKLYDERPADTSWLGAN